MNLNRRSIEHFLAQRSARYLAISPLKTLNAIPFGRLTKLCRCSVVASFLLFLPGGTLSGLLDINSFKYTIKHSFLACCCFLAQLLAHCLSIAVCISVLLVLWNVSISICLQQWQWQWCWLLLIENTQCNSFWLANKLGHITLGNYLRYLALCCLMCCSVYLNKLDCFAACDCVAARYLSISINDNVHCWFLKTHSTILFGWQMKLGRRSFVALFILFFPGGVLSALLLERVGVEALITL